MPANLTPQYRLAEQWYKQATTLPEKIDALRDMMAIIPKHKGTEHLRAGLRSRMSKHVHELENPKGSVGGGTQPFNIRKEGIGQSVLIGLANSGKSELLNALTGMHAKVGDYQFTTQIPNVGMIQFEKNEIYHYTRISKLRIVMTFLMVNNYRVYAHWFPVLFPFLAYHRSRWSDQAFPKSNLGNFQTRFLSV